MLIQVVKVYIDYSKNNRLPKILCDFDPDHGLVYPNLDYEDRIFLYCLACDYKNYIGIEHYDLMKLAVENEINSQ
jgi:hypothetical protein